MAISNGDIVRITCKFAVLGNDVQNVYHVQVTTTGAVSDATFLSEMATDIDSMHDDIDNELHTSVSFETIEMYNLTQDTYIGEVSWPSKTAGLASGDRLPMQCSALLLFPTAVLRSQGRKFLPPMSELGTTSGGAPSTALLASLANFAADVLATKTGTSWSAICGNWNGDLVRFAAWTSAIVADFFATQRRRYLGRGS